MSVARQMSAIFRVCNMASSADVYNALQTVHALKYSVLKTSIYLSIYLSISFVELTLLQSFKEIVHHKSTKERHYTHLDWLENE